MQTTSSGEGDYSDEEKLLPIIKDIKEWVGLPIEEYSKNVEILITQLNDIDSKSDNSMLTQLLTTNTVEHFANGMYAREATIPAGVAVVSRIHMEAGISVLAKGRIAVMDREGYKELVAPYTFTAEAGVQRIGLTLTECNWVSIFKADKHPNIDMLEVVTAKSLHDYNRRKTCQDLYQQ